MWFHTQKRRKEVIKISAEMNEIENRKNIQKTNETKNGFYGKSNKIDKSLDLEKQGRFTFKESEKKRDITTEIRKIIKEFNDWLNAKKVSNWDEADKDLKRHKLLKRNSE